MRAHFWTVAIVLVNLSSLAQATTITGSYTTPSPASVDLTSGTNGWVRDYGFDSQITGGTGLSLFSHVGSFGTSEIEANPATSFTPDGGNGPTAGSRYPVVGGPNQPQPNGTGYAITVSGSSLAQTLQIYVSRYQAGTSLVAGDFTSILSPADEAGVWTINIPAGYGPLTASYTVDSTTFFLGNISVYGATVTVPEPNAIALLGMGAVGLLLAKRRRK